MTQLSEPMQAAGDELEEEPKAWRYLVILGLLRMAVSSVVAGRGLTALSDDDYARVTIAQQFAGHAKFDPSGTSWLPFPFWATGTVMKVLDPSLDVARLAASI